MREGFSILMVEKIPLGMYSGLLSKVRILVSRQPIFSTVPSISRSGDLIQSPTTKGLSQNIIIPPKKLAKVSLAAKPTAKPPTEPKANKVVIFRPKACINPNVAKIITMIRNTWLTNLILVRSSFCNSQHRSI